MPSGVRNTTPGPSEMGKNATSQSGISQGRNEAKKRDAKAKEKQNVLKRRSSEEDEDERERKKVKIICGLGEEDDNHETTNGKEIVRKKKRRRRGAVSRRNAKALISSRSVDSVNESNEQQTTSFPAVGEDDDTNTIVHPNKSSDKQEAEPKSDTPLVAENKSTTDQTAEVVSLTEKLAEQRKLLEKHQAYLIQHQQTLTCHICLELMHRPYALTPCGHVTCYDCLVRWFTSTLNDDEQTFDDEQANDVSSNDIFALLNSAAARRGTFVRRRKTCPVCRGHITDRPVEMWDIKKMVAALVKSQLVDLPVPAGGDVAEERISNPQGVDENNNDPWKNVFKPRSLRRQEGHPHIHLEPDGNDGEQLGWYDHEDGGVFRCFDCFHEIWGGVCTECERVYPGHPFEEDDDEENEDSEINYLMEALEPVLDVWISEEEEDDNSWIVHSDEEGGPVEATDFDEAPLDYGDIDVESSDGFVDDEEESRHQGLYDAADSDPESDIWSRTRNLQPGTYTTYTVDLSGWSPHGEDIAEDTDEGIFTPLRGRRQAVIESASSASSTSSSRRESFHTSRGSSLLTESDETEGPQWSARLRLNGRRRIIESENEENFEVDSDRPVSHRRRSVIGDEEDEGPAYSRLRSELRSLRRRRIQPRTSGE